MTLMGVSFLGFNQYQNYSATNTLNSFNDYGYTSQNSNLSGYGDPFEAFNSAMEVIGNETMGMDQSGYNGPLASLNNFMSGILAMLGQINAYDNSTNNSYNYTTPGNSYSSNLFGSLSGLNTGSSSVSDSLYSQSWVNNLVKSFTTDLPNTISNVSNGVSKFLGSVSQEALNLGQKVADAAKSVASSMNSKGWCYRGVATALAKFGVSLSGKSAYMAADQLANSDKFEEIQVSKDELKNLPAGAVVVWNKGNGHEHGHISVALGNGQEASDHVQSQIVNYGTSFRVFMPKA